MEIAILHLSDIHFHSEQDKITSLASDIASTCFQFSKSVDAFLIVVTGDIAFSGKHEEYLIAETFLKSIKEKIKGEDVAFIDILVVPGNHDCTLRPEKVARSILIEQVVSNPHLAEDDSIIETCTEAQQNFFSFRNLITQTKPIFDNPLFTEYEFLVKTKVIRFSAINAAWMSRIPEKPGQLVYPANKFSETLSQPAEFRCVLLHHPLNWYCPNSFHELRSLIGTHASIVLSGHEHAKYAVEINELNSGSCLYIEADALQPHEDSAPKGYSIILLHLGGDLTVESVNQSIFKIEANKIVVADTLKTSLKTSNNQNSQKLAIKREFLKIISDPGGSFIHPEKEHLQLDDIFVYPEINEYYC